MFQSILQDLLLLQPWRQPFSYHEEVEINQVLNRNNQLDGNGLHQEPKGNDNRAQIQRFRFPKLNLKNPIGGTVLGSADNQKAHKKSINKLQKQDGDTQHQPTTKLKKGIHNDNGECTQELVVTPARLPSNTSRKTISQQPLIKDGMVTNTK